MTMSKDIIKNSRNNEKIKETKEEINSRQIEESQKKAVKYGSKSKVIKTDDTEPYITMRDYSGKIKFNKRDKVDDAALDNIKTGGMTADVVKTNGNTHKIIRKGNNKTHITKANKAASDEHIPVTQSAIRIEQQTPPDKKPFKHKTSANAHIKEKSSSDSVKHFDRSIIKDDNGNVVRERNSTSAQKKRNYKKHRRKKPYTYKDNASVHSEKTSKVIIDNHNLEVDVLPQNQTTALSYTAREYLADKTDETVNTRSKLSEMTRKNTVKKISDRNNHVNETSDKASLIKETSTIPLYTDNEISTNEQAVKEDYSYKDKKDLVFTEKSDVVIDDNRLVVDVLPQNQTAALSYTTKEYLSEKLNETVNTRSKLSEMAHRKTVKEISDYECSILETEAAFQYIDNETSKTAQAVKQEFSYSDVVKAEHNIPLKSHNSSISETPKKAKSDKSGKNKQTLTSYGSDIIKEKIRGQAESSDDNSVKTMAVGISAAETAIEILKPDTQPKFTKGNKRKTVYNKGQLLDAAKNLSIKAEFKNRLENGLVYMNNSSHKALKTGGSAIVKSIKDGISEAGENDLAFKSVDDAIKTVDTAASIEKGIRTAVNSGRNTVNIAIGTAKAVKNAPKNIENKVTGLKKQVRKLQKIRAMKNGTKRKLKSKAVKEAANKVLGAAKAAAIKFIAILLAVNVLIVGICGVVVAAIGSFIWQTSSDLDTTQIIKLLSELDYNRQNTWYTGKTGVNIAKYNDTHNSSFVDYHYLLAVDIPPEYTADGVVSEGAIECCVTVGERRNGSQRKPVYRGFNREFSSCDEMLEQYRWTTDDYRAALAYLQVKNENLGWFSTILGFVGEARLRQSARELHKATYDQSIVIKTVVPDTEDEYVFCNDIYNTSYSDNGATDYYYFGRKFSVKYLIDNDIVRFDDDDSKNKSMKERYEYVYKYGNFAVGNLSFPLVLADGEKIADRISKHFGKQLTLEYIPPNPSPNGRDVWGTVSTHTGYHYANDFSADDGDIIFAPIGGLCKVAERENRGFEYSICTSYNGSEFDFTKEGYLVKISCSSASYISSSEPKVVTKGDLLGIVADNIGVNYMMPKTDNDVENEDIFANKLFPCSTSTDYHSIGENEFTIPAPEKNHIHIEMYKLPCDFNDAASIEDNVLAPELFFDYSKEID